ncbi:MAG TPA: potassium transporter TrkG [Bacteroidales bacterium]|nr:potassium transporter TrkG [Bacteroidales bacterium]
MKTFLKEVNIKLIARIIGFLLILESFFMFSAVVVGWYFHGLESAAMLVATFTTLLSGLIIFLFNFRTNNNLGKREGYIIVSLTWIITSFFGALPFYIGGHIPSFTDAFFETMSGLTTTGSSILTDIEAMPRDLLFWRSLTHWLGGMGIIVLSVAILPILGIGGMQLFMAEMPGVTYDKLHPRITSTAKRLWGIYVLLTLLCFLFLWAGEMDWFDAVNHAFATLATGGFSTRNLSMAAFGAYSQYVVIVFMIFAGTNFTLHYFALHGRLRQVFRDEEFRGFLLLIAISTFIITVGLVVFGKDTLEENFRNALFTVSSILTTTGFVTANYLSWPVFLYMIILLLMFVGGMAGSTGGGMKVIRQMLLLKNSWMELRRSIHPNAVLPVKFNNKSVPQEIIYKVMGFFLMYILIFTAGVLSLSALGLNFETSIGASIASLGNIGPGIGLVGPVDNYAAMPDAAKWILSALMMLGRLELFTVLLLFSKHFWRK